MMIALVLLLIMNSCSHSYDLFHLHVDVELSLTSF